MESGPAHSSSIAFRLEWPGSSCDWARSQPVSGPTYSGDLTALYPGTGRTPSVITIHDLTSITIPGHHRLKTVLSFNTFITRSLERATRIAAVSRSTADELVRGFGVPSASIEVVPNGVSEYFSASEVEGDEALLPSRLSSRNYILYVGTLEPRKGVDDLIRAWEGLPSSSRPRLVLAGDPGWKAGSMRTRAEVWVQRRELMMTGFIDRATLRALYRHAAVFVYPSHYEGFGLPPLEAMACGAPVVRQSRRSHPGSGR